VKPRARKVSSPPLEIVVVGSAVSVAYAYCEVRVGTGDLGDCPTAGFRGRAPVGVPQKPDIFCTSIITYCMFA